MWLQFGDNEPSFDDNRLFVFENGQMIVVVDYDTLWTRGLLKRHKNKGVWPITGYLSGVIERYVRCAVCHAKKS